MSELLDQLGAHTLSPDTVAFELIPTEQLRDRLVTSVLAARRRVIVQGMSMTYDDETSPLFDLLVEKAPQIDDVMLLPDAYSLRFSDAHKRINPFGEKARAIRRFVRYTDTLTDEGGKVRFTNPYGHLQANPYAGRNHMKFVVVDDELYDFSGVDWKTNGFRYIDSMLFCESAPLANNLAALAMRSYITGRLDTGIDLPQKIDATSRAITDTGMPGRSAIYDHAVLQLAASDVTGITFLSQMRPTGRMERVLLDKQHALGPDSVRVFSNAANRLVLPARVTEMAKRALSDLAVEQLDTEYYLHEKLVLVTYDLRPPLVIKGSHNLLERGVRYGTQDRMLFTTEPGLTGQVMDYLEILGIDMHGL